MIDLEFRSQATLPEKWQTGRFGDVGDSVLYHSMPELGSRQAERAGSELCTSGASLARDCRNFP